GDDERDAARSEQREVVASEEHAVLDGVRARLDGVADASPSVTVHDHAPLGLVRFLHDDPQVLAGEDRAQHVRAPGRRAAGDEDLDPVDAGLRLLSDETPDLRRTVDLSAQEPAGAARDRQGHAGYQDPRAANEALRDGGPQLQIDVA